MTDLAFGVSQDGNPVSGLVENLTLGYLASTANTATGWAIYSEATNTFKGGMDDFRLWNVALTGEQVNTLFNAEN